MKKIIVFAFLLTYASSVCYGQTKTKAILAYEQIILDSDKYFGITKPIIDSLFLSANEKFSKGMWGEAIPEYKNYIDNVEYFSNIISLCYNNTSLNSGSRRDSYFRYLYDHLIRNRNQAFENMATCYNNIGDKRSSFHYTMLLLAQIKASDGPLDLWEKETDRVCNFVEIDIETEIKNRDKEKWKINTNPFSK